MRNHSRQLVVLFALGLVIPSLFISSMLSPNNNSTTEIKTNVPSLSTPLTALSVQGKESGVGTNLSAYEYAQYTNSAIQVNLADNTSSTYQLTSVETPAEWTGYKLTSDISELTDNTSWIVNSNLDTQNPWKYVEYDPQDWDNGTTGNNTENSWGWYGNSASSPGGSGGLCLNHGYQKESYQSIGDPQDSREYCAFTQNITVNRGIVSAIKVKFDFNKTFVGGLGGGSGWDSLFVSINGNRLPPFSVFTSAFDSNKIYTIEYDVPALDIPAIFSNPVGEIKFTIGISQQTSGCYWESTDTRRDAVVLDNIYMYLQAEVKPSQVQLRVNDTVSGSPVLVPVQDRGFGAGYVVINGSWINPSVVNSQPLSVNFSIGQSTDVRLLTNLTQYVNHTSYTKTFAGIAGSEFTISNNTNCNWTGYFYATTPPLYSEYNFSIFCPDDWMLWALYDPTPNDVISEDGIDFNSGRLDVSAKRATQFPGRWRMEFFTPNYAMGLTTYTNTSFPISPNSWISTNEVYAGNYLNVTAQIIGSQTSTDTLAQLEIWFPNGTIWQDCSQEKNVIAGIVAFDEISIPTSGPDYIAGDYTVFVTWNNTRGATQCNETGLFSKTIAIKHYARLVPDDANIYDVINGTTKKIRVTYTDFVTGAPINDSSVVFQNFGGSIQTLGMIDYGYYSTDLWVAVTGAAGSYNITVNATHPHFQAIGVNITLAVIIDTTLSSSIYPTVTVQSNENFTLNLMYYQSTNPSAGIDGATIILDKDPKWDIILTPSGEAGAGKYILMGNNSQFAINSYQEIKISASKFGFQAQNLTIKVKITPRTAVFQTILMNGTDHTLLPSYQLAMTKWLNLSVRLSDELLGTPLWSSNVNLTGVNATPSPLNVAGGYYQILLNSSELGIGVHFLNLEGNTTNYAQTKSTIQISVEPIATSIYTAEHKTTYSILKGNNFPLKIRVDDLDFGGSLTSFNLSYEWRYGSGLLTGPDAEGYFTAELPNVPIGTWTITIRVNGTGSNYEFDELTLTLVSTEPIIEGTPEWSIYTLVTAIAVVFVLFALYQTTYKYPKFIREVRSLRRQIKRGKITGGEETRGRGVSKIFTEQFNLESKGTMTLSQKSALKQQHPPAEDESAPEKSETSKTPAPESSKPAEVTATPSSEPTSVPPPQTPVKPELETLKPSAAPTPPVATEQPPEKPAPKAKPPRRSLKLSGNFTEVPQLKMGPKPKPLPPIKLLPSPKTLPTVKSLPTEKALPAGKEKPPAKPAPKSGEKSEEVSGEEEK